MTFPFVGSSVDLDFIDGQYWDANTVLLLHMDGTDSSTTFTDSSGRHTVSVSAGPIISTANSKFGGASALFAGTGHLDLDGSSDFSFGTGDFTVEAWIYVTDLTNDQVIITTHTSDVAWELKVKSDGHLRGNLNNIDELDGAAGSIVVSTWYHIALTRASAVTRLFLNGVIQTAGPAGASYADTNNYNIRAGYPTIGIDTNQITFFNGNIDELRIVKGVASWSAAFTPPSAAYNIALPSDSLSCSRASIGYAKTSAGTLTQFANNVLRITDLGLLIEDARTNLQVHSQAFTDAGYAGTNLTVTDNFAAAPDTTTTASKALPTATNAVHSIAGAAITTIASTTYTLSVFANAEGYNWIQLDLDRVGVADHLASFNVSAGTIGTVDAAVTASIEALGSGWFRCVATITTDVGQILVTPKVYINNADTAGTGVAYAGDGSSYVLLWGLQVEQAAFISSYVPTTTTSATRAADVIATAGSLNTIVTATAFSALVDAIHPIALATLGPSQQILLQQTGSGTLPMEATINNDNKVTFPGQIEATLGRGNIWSTGAKAALGCDAIGQSIVGGGGSVASNTPATAPFSPSFTVGQGWFGNVRRLVAWTTRLADATLQAYSDPTYDIATLLTTQLAAVGRGTVTSGGGSTSIPASAMTFAAAAGNFVVNQFAGRLVLFDGDTTTAGLRAAQSVIRASSAGPTPNFIVDALPATPANGDSFSVI